ncbi:hypothetical protein FRACA_20012 [Frankia canadensis]|uniref:Uncharacterized protein n=1 Tax=Frankia canadensis TaxID=1836972 RepID=A0A2I2KPN7_9ACTN|nr:hypothetical protein FRACA_20012 [Frankia canadensis]SOU54906.1 hypothetical protein FRACA_20012 [Frankia canadensis]
MRRISGGRRTGAAGGVPGRYGAAGGRAEDVLHWQHRQRPISAETLRKRLHVGADTARGLVAQIRSDTHPTLDNQPPEAAST